MVDFLTINLYRTFPEGILSPGLHNPTPAIFHGTERIAILMLKQKWDNAFHKYLCLPIKAPFHTYGKTIHRVLGRGGHISIDCTTKLTLLTLGHVPKAGVTPLLCFQLDAL